MDFKTFKTRESPFQFNSYITPTNETNLRSFRLLDVDNRAILPFNTHIQVLTTRVDVLHSWSVPALGIKIDSCPGRLNQSLIIRYQPGVFFGQCSELCGSNHSFIPIVIEFLNVNLFIKWLIKQI